MSNQTHTEEQLTSIEWTRRKLGQAAANMVGVIGDYSHMVEAEPVLQLITPGAAWVVEGQHGPTLVSRTMAVWDVDSESSEFAFDSGDDAEVMAALTSALQPVMPNDSFRAYRTLGGLRVICTSRPYSLARSADSSRYASERDYQEVAELLKADPRYTAGVMLQRACYMRLKPKSPSHPSRSCASGSGYQVRTCKWIGNIDGQRGALPSAELTDQLRFHDEETNACGYGDLF